ncbi:hypothetical protein CY35_17G056600 [Sphagnum magellanicum]|nr:hypothetical protein CY35_17G056600 [Sphagnum magellanicum]
MAGIISLQASKVFLEADGKSPENVPSELRLGLAEDQSLRNASLAVRWKEDLKYHGRRGNDANTWRNLIRFFGVLRFIRRQELLGFASGVEWCHRVWNCKGRSEGGGGPNHGVQAQPSLSQFRQPGKSWWANYACIHHHATIKCMWQQLCYSRCQIYVVWTFNWHSDVLPFMVVGVFVLCIKSSCTLLLLYSYSIDPHFCDMLHAGVSAYL